MTWTEVRMTAPWHTSVSQIHLPPVSVSPGRAAAAPHPPTSPGALQTSKKACPCSYQVAAFTLGPRACEILCAPFKGEGFISLSPLRHLKLSPPGLQSSMLWGRLLLMPDTRLGIWAWGSDLSLSWEILCSIIILQFAGLPPRGAGSESTPPTCLAGVPSLCL